MIDDSGRNAEFRERLVQMHDTLRAMLVVVRSVADEHDGDFADPSPARSEWTARGAQLSGDLQEAYRTGVVFWHAVIDHGHALADLIETRRTYAVMTVARSLAESAVRSWNLLEEGLSPHDRIERMLNERLYANHENQLLLNGLQPHGNSTTPVGQVARAAGPVIRQRIAMEQSESQSLLDMARTHQIAPIKQSRAGAARVGKGRSTTMSLLGRILEHDPQGDSFFRMNSAIAHSSLHGHARMIFMTERGDGRYTSKPIPMHPDDLCAQAWVGVAATAIAAVTLFKQVGWPDDALDAATAKLMVAWNPPPDEALLREFEALT